MTHRRLSRHARTLAPLALAAATALASAALTVSPASAASSAFTSTAANQGSGNCMDDPGSSTATGTQLIQWSCNGGTNQNWTFTPVSGTSASYTIANAASGLCVDVSGRSTADNAKVIQWSCNGQSNQQFTLVAASGGNTFALQAVHSGKCIVPSGDSTANNTVLVQLPCNGAGTRVWQLPGYGGGSPGGGGGTGAPCHASTCVQYNGGSNGVITQSPKVYLVFYGSQWGGSGGDTQSQNEGFFKGLGTGGERWSTVLTQYCNAVPAGTQTCPASATHIPYPSSSVYGGTWFDSSQPAPAAPGDDLITEARNAAGHFGVTGQLARSIFIIFSPAGTSAGGGYSWHTTTSDGYNVINAAYGEQNTIVTSHEYAETMTDVNAGWTTADKTNEVADLCGPDGNLNLTTGSFPVTSVWSNQDSGCVVAD